MGTCKFSGLRFLIHFTKGNNFCVLLFASLEDKALLIKERNSFLKRVDPNLEERQK